MIKQITSRQFFSLQFAMLFRTVHWATQVPCRPGFTVEKAKWIHFHFRLREPVKPWAYIYDMRCKWYNRKSAEGSLLSFRENKAKST